MRSLLAVGVLLCVVVAGKGETTEGFQKIIRPLAVECKECKAVAGIDCKDKETGTDADVESVVHLGPEFSPVAKCMAACVMHKLGLMADGTLETPEKMLVPYETIFADDPKRTADSKRVLSYCHDVALKDNAGKSCDIAYAAIACTLQQTE